MTAGTTIYFPVQVEGGLFSIGDTHAAQGDGEVALTALEASLRGARDAGRKLLVPYITGGYPGWQDAIRACAANGADAVEIGIPFSDPVMDGPVIQAASQASLDAGTTPATVLDAVPGLDVDVPLAVMTYYNLVHHPGPTRFAAQLARQAETIGRAAEVGGAHREVLFQRRHARGPDK